MLGAGRTRSGGAACCGRARLCRRTDSPKTNQGGNGEDFPAHRTFPCFVGCSLPPFCCGVTSSFSRPTRERPAPGGRSEGCATAYPSERWLRFPMGAGCVITTGPDGRPRGFRERNKPGRRKGAADTRRIAVLSVVLGGTRAAPVQVGLRALRLFHVVLGLLLSGSSAAEEAAGVLQVLRQGRGKPNRGAAGRSRGIQAEGRFKTCH